MTKDEIRSKVEALAPWFHQIDLGDGIKTKTRAAAQEPIDHPQSTWRVIKDWLPADLTDKSVLDVGCNGGFYAIEAKKRNARRVLGVDVQRLHIRQARFVNRALRLDMEFERMSVYDLSPQNVGQFDVTLALGLIYHCKHVILALERLFQVTKEMLILESAVFHPSLLSQSFSDSSFQIGRQVHALAYVENDPAAKEAVYNWFVPTPECLCAMLRDVGFTQVELVSDQNSRAVIVGRRAGRESDSHTNLHLLAARISVLEAPRTCSPNAAIDLRVEAHNTGQSIWLDRGEGSNYKGVVRLGVHLLNEDGEQAVQDYAGKSVSTRVPPGAGTTFSLQVKAPSTPGIYYFEFDMVSEHLTWFEDCGSTVPVTHRFEVV